MDAQSICHNRSQLIIPQENHRTFVSVYNWICAAGVRQPHNPDCNSHLCLLGALKAPSVRPQETRSKGNTAQRAVSVLTSSLACPVKSPVEKNTSSFDKLRRWMVLFVKYLACYQGFQSLMQLKRTWKNNPIVRGTMFKKTWFVAIHIPLWESLCSLTWQTASASKHFGFNTFQHTKRHCKIHLQNIYPLWSFRGKFLCNMILIYL